MVSPINEQTPFHPELERLICAAVSNDRFAEDLLSDPAIALDYSGHTRLLSPDEREMVVSILGARDIYDFAARLRLKLLQGHMVEDIPLPG